MLHHKNNSKFSGNNSRKCKDDNTGQQAQQGSTHRPALQPCSCNRNCLQTPNELATRHKTVETATE